MGRMLEIGAVAPKFELPSSLGGRFGSDDLAGKAAVIVFYPKNNTPG